MKKKMKKQVGFLLCVVYALLTASGRRQRKPKLLAKWFPTSQTRSAKAFLECNKTITLLPPCARTRVSSTPNLLFKLHSALQKMVKIEDSQVLSSAPKTIDCAFCGQSIPPDAQVDHDCMKLLSESVKPGWMNNLRSKKIAPLCSLGLERLNVVVERTQQTVRFCVDLPSFVAFFFLIAFLCSSTSLEELFDPLFVSSSDAPPQPQTQVCSVCSVFFFYFFFTFHFFLNFLIERIGTFFVIVLVSLNSLARSWTKSSL